MKSFEFEMLSVVAEPVLSALLKTDFRFYVAKQSHHTHLISIYEDDDEKVLEFVNIHIDPEMTLETLQNIHMDL